jgi:flagellar motor switch protein FliN/FliY
VSDGVLSQEEINALLNGGLDSGSPSENQNGSASSNSPSVSLSNNLSTKDSFTSNDINQLTEVAKLSLGATSSVVQIFIGKDNANISLEQARVITYSDLLQECGNEDYLVLKITYTQGFDGVTFLLLKKQTVAIIGDLAMGGSGENSEFQEIHISANQEMLNQMMGKTTTSLAEIFKKRVDISPPAAEMVNFSQTLPSNLSEFHDGANFFRIGFRINLGDVATAEMIQLLPADFALTMAHELNKPEKEPSKAQVAPPPPSPPEINLPPMNGVGQQNTQGQMPNQMPGMMPSMTMPGQMPNMGMPGMFPAQMSGMIQGSPAEFNPLQMPGGVGLQSNIDLLLDVPLEITVELGRTKMLIKDVLELGIGSVVELNKLAGESVEIFVNNKLIAKGEVVVIDENFAVRIVNIINPQDRLQAL